MLKSIMLVCALAAVGCKADAKESTSGSSAATTAETPAGDGTPKPRSGKIDLGSRRNHDGAGGAATSTMDPADRKLQLEERRKARMALTDTDGDGEISEAERIASRTRRATDLHGRLDTNSDGKVTAEELASSSFRRFDPAGVDANKDGDITIDELTKALELRGRQWGAGRRNRFGVPTPVAPAPAEPTPTPAPAPAPPAKQ
jgi:hypothetical protein